jgi:hypothetical protein
MFLKSVFMTVCTLIFYFRLKVYEWNFVMPCFIFIMGCLYELHEMNIWPPVCRHFCSSTQSEGSLIMVHILNRFIRTNQVVGGIYCVCLRVNWMRALHESVCLFIEFLKSKAYRTKHFSLRHLINTKANYIVSLFDLPSIVWHFPPLFRNACGRSHK